MALVGYTLLLWLLTGRARAYWMPVIRLCHS